MSLECMMYSRVCCHHQNRIKQDVGFRVWAVKNLTAAKLRILSTLALDSHIMHTPTLVCTLRS